MGLDMYLQGNKFFWTDWENEENNRHEDGFRVRDLNVQLGYWRKHPNLHGYIVHTFARGVDDCQEIDLSVDDLRKTIEAVAAKNLPQTEGFFFGASAMDDEETADTIKQIEGAIAWLETEEKGISRSVVYRASW